MQKQIAFKFYNADVGAGVYLKCGNLSIEFSYYNNRI